VRRRRLILYAALALAAPVPAFALELGSGSPSGAGSLDAQASLDSCGLFENQIVCKIDVSYNEIAGAERYTASVAAPTGSVSDFGSVGAGGTSLWVPYSGDGDYSVTIQAWGTAPASHKKRELVASDEVSAGNRHTGGHRVRTGKLAAVPRPDAGQGTVRSVGSHTPAPSPDAAPSCEPTPSTEPPPDPTGDPSDTGSSGDAGTDATAGASAAADPAAADASAATLGGSDVTVGTLETQGEVPNSTTPPDCPPAPPGN